MTRIDSYRQTLGASERAPRSSGNRGADFALAVQLAVLPATNRQAEDAARDDVQTMPPRQTGGTALPAAPPTAGDSVFKQPPPRPTSQLIEPALPPDPGPLQDAQPASDAHASAASHPDHVGAAPLEPALPSSRPGPPDVRTVRAGGFTDRDGSRSRFSSVSEPAERHEPPPLRTPEPPPPVAVRAGAGETVVVRPWALRADGHLSQQLLVRTSAGPSAGALPMAAPCASSQPVTAALVGGARGLPEAEGSPRRALAATSYAASEVPATDTNPTARQRNVADAVRPTWWAQRLLRWFETTEGVIVWLRDFSLTSAEMPALIEDTLSACHRDGVHVARIVVNGRQVWAASTSTLSRQRNDR